MNRVKLTLPDHFPFSTRIKIRITDLNYGGHVGNDTFLSLVHDARQQFLKHHGYGELEFESVGLIMADAVIEFRSEINFGDEVDIHVVATDFTRLGFDLYYKMEIVHPDGNVLAGKVKTGMLCYDYPAKKVVSVPETAKNKLLPSV
jgi:acyl-CoA thioester hydrolase